MIHFDMDHSIWFILDAYETSVDQVSYCYMDHITWVIESNAIGPPVETDRIFLCRFHEKTFDVEVLIYLVTKKKKSST